MMMYAGVFTIVCGVGTMALGANRQRKKWIQLGTMLCLAGFGLLLTVFVQALP